ncbi:hypothetical protein ACEZCY_19175 [Streptacidiphilus sp. N1-12]|uniref:Uncharacterized protein n=2 Tax=Streptacidiphilus alkalitolerans TaxID=3342712 RepID=A0ABV6WH24_9ACTN
MLTIDGTASTALKEDAGKFVRAVASVDQTVNSIVTVQDIRLLVLVEKVKAAATSSSEESDADDQETLVEWKQPNTRITVIMPVDALGSGLHSGLLHELILHAAPAARTHLTARARQAAPVFPVTDAAILAQEAQEHADQALWQRMADIAVLLNDEQLLSRSIIDAGNHGKPLARRVVQALLAKQSITQDYSVDLNKEINLIPDVV